MAEEAIVHVERGSNSTETRGVQIKSTVMYHFTHTGTSTLKRWIMPKWHGSGETGNLCPTDGSADRCTHAEKLPGQSVKCVYAPCLSCPPPAPVAQ